ncbi:LuxR family transcriptional regulator [Citricoccus sp. K5]|uniref:helix-turn-helix transcriptional regulator n=1 Tax=Citricoccus sp. K5 TaxID=2653135 RepID=UPI0012F1740D|nr:LuxR family transcriptional regulator [Citricoccus sp. K5]VXC11817.1 AAA ATPase-like protein [Citricoccus sp. K5]
MTQHPHGQSKTLPGRTADLQRLNAVWERVQTGVPQFVAVEGPAGMGKTTLVETFLNGKRNVLPAVEVYPTDADVPGALIQRLLSTITGQYRAQWPTAVEDYVQVVLDTIQTLGETADGSVITVVEDLQWADRFSAEVLLRCAQAMISAPFMIILTFRPQASELTVGIEHFLASGRRGTHLQLDPLGATDCRQVLRERLGIPVSEDFARKVHGGTGGVPLLVGAVAAWLDQAPPGHRRLQDAMAALSTGQNASQRLFGRALQSSLEAVSHHLRDTLSLLAVAGEPLHIVHLSGALVELGYPGLPDHGLLDSDQVRITHTAGTVSLSHPHLATLVAAQLPTRRRAELHRILAPILNGPVALGHRVQAQRLDPEPAETPLLVRTLMQYGGEALGRGDGVAAFGHFHQALRLTGDPVALTLALRATILARRPDLVLELRDVLAGLPQSRSGCAARAWDLLASEDLEGAVDQIRQGLHLPEDDPGRAGLLLLGHALAAAGRTAYATARFGAVGSTIDALLAELVPVRREFEHAARQDPQALRQVSEARSVEALLALWSGLRHGDRSRVGEFTEQMTSLLEDLRPVPGTKPVRSVISAVIGSRLRAQGEVAAASRILDATAQDAQVPREQRVFLETTLSQLAFHQGAWDRALEHATQAVDSCLMQPLDSGVRSAYATAALVPLARGEQQAGRQLLQRAVADAGTTSEVVDCAVAFARAMGATFASDHPEAARQFQLIESTRVGWATAGFTTVCLYARALAETGQMDRLQALAVHATEGMDSAPEGVLRAVEAATLGALYRARAQPDEAREQLVEALAALDAEPVAYVAGIGPDVPPGGGHALVRAFLALDLSRLAMDGTGTGERPEEGMRDAGRWARQAADFFLRCGAMPLQGAAEEVVTGLRKRQEDTATGPAAGQGAERAHEPVSAPAQAAFRLMAELSTRERQIAVAVAEGKADREIATELFLSVRTVEYHVGNCLEKLGMTSRVELRKALQPATLTLLVPALSGAGPEDGVPADQNRPSAP